MDNHAGGTYLQETRVADYENIQRYGKQTTVSVCQLDFLTTD
jgi:hypothetical protein